MRTSLVCAVGLGVPLLTIGAPAEAVSRTGRGGSPVQAFFCDSAVHAIAFADLMAKGEGEEVARSRVDRQAGAEACGLYAGIAAIESESVMLRGGVAYKLTAYRFREDQRLAWRAATTFAPVASSWSL